MMSIFNFYSLIIITHSRTQYNSIAGHTRTHASSNFTQIRMLLSRSFLAQARDTAALKTALFKSVFVGLIIGIVFFDLANPSPPFYTVDPASGESLLTPGVQNLASAFFFFLMYCLMNNLEQIPAICLNQNLYRRELASYSYSAAPYWLVNCLYPLPLCLVTHTIWFVMSFYMCGFTQSLDYFMYFYWITFWTTVAAFYYAQGMAAGTQSAEVSFALFPVTFVFLTQFTGYSITIHNIPSGWKWASYISFPRWTFEGLMVNDFGDRGEEGDEVLEQYGFDDFEKMNAMWIIFFCTAVCALTSYIFLRKPASKLVYSSQLVTDVATHVEQQCSSASSDIGSDEWLVLDEEVAVHSALDSSQDHGGIDNSPLLHNEDMMHQLSVMPMSHGCPVTFSNVEYRVTSRHTKKELRVLKGVSGRASPGEICALMGASGAGELFNALHDHEHSTIQ
jgi:ATP-binding cassette, subfamily G (WHITE), member 2, SNQ2